MGVRNWQAGLLASVGMLVVVPALHAGERNDGSYVPPLPPMPVSMGWQAVYRDVEGQNGGAPGATEVSGSDARFVRELLAILGETHSQDAFLVTLSILQEMKADPRLAVPVIIRNAERLKLFACTEPDQVTENQRMVAECIVGLIKREGVPLPVCAPPAPPCGADSGAIAGALVGGTVGSITTGTPVRGSTISEDPSVAPPAGTTKPTSGEVIPGNAKSRRARKW